MEKIEGFSPTIRGKRVSIVKHYCREHIPIVLHYLETRIAYAIISDHLVYFAILITIRIVSPFNNLLAYWNDIFVGFVLLK